MKLPTVPMPLPERKLVTRRNQPIQPHRLMEPLIEMLGEWCETFHGVGHLLDDKRWTEAADTIERARAILRNDTR